MTVSRRHAITFASRLGLGSVLAGLGGLSGCSLQPDFDHAAAEAPRFEPRLMRPRRLALVLSSGGPRGFVHVGVLKALDEIGIKPDLIVGGSVGALVGAVYASGVGGRELEKMALELGVTDMGRLAVGGEARLSGRPIAEYINRELRAAPMERLPIAFASAAIERDSRKPVLFNAGDCGVAVQASCAIEGTFTPVRIRGTQYVDADRVAPLPVRLARSLGAQRVLAVDASAHEDRAPEGALRFREGDLLKRALTKPDAQAADLTLHPEFGYWVSLSREFRERAIRSGYEQTLAQTARIQSLMV
jgi:NTE family protein